MEDNKIKNLKESIFPNNSYPEYEKSVSRALELMTKSNYDKNSLALLKDVPLLDIPSRQIESLKGLHNTIFQNSEIKDRKLITHPYDEASPISYLELSDKVNILLDVLSQTIAHNFNKRENSFIDLSHGNNRESIFLGTQVNDIFWHTSFGKGEGAEEKYKFLLMYRPKSPEMNELTYNLHYYNLLFFLDKKITAWHNRKPQIIEDLRLSHTYFSQDYNDKKYYRPGFEQRYSSDLQLKKITYLSEDRKIIYGGKSLKDSRGSANNQVSKKTFTAIDKIRIYLENKLKRENKK